MKKLPCEEKTCGERTLVRPCKQPAKYIILWGNGAQRTICAKHTLVRKKSGAYWQIHDLQN